MHLPLLQPISELGNKHLRLLNTPAHDLGQQKQPPPLSALGTVQEIPAANLLHPGIRGPAIDRDFVHVFNDVDKADVPGVRGQVPDFVKRLAEALGRVVEDVAPLAQNVVWSQGAVVALELDAHLDFVQIAAGLQVVEDLLVQRGPVGDGTVQGADVDEVEAVRKGPG